MADLGIRTALSQIEVALQRAILLAFGTRTIHATAAALRTAFASSKLHHNQVAYVTAIGYAFTFDRFSTSTDDGTTVLRPSDNPTAGRWLVSTSTTSTGYLKAVKLYEGEVSEENMLTWLFGQVPSAIVVWEGEQYETKSMIPGALYRYSPEFSIWACSRNLRGEKQGALGAYASGPLTASEQTTDPGVNRIIGDLRFALAGQDLDQDGVDWCEILGSDRVLSSSTMERGHVYRLRVKVYASLHNTDRDDASNPAHDLDRIDVAWRHASGTGADGEEYADTHITAAAYLAAAASGLNWTVTGGTIYIDGAAVTAATLNHSQSANTVAYRFVDAAGAWTVTETAIGAERPTTPTGEVLVGVTETNASAVVIDRVVAPWLYAMGLTDEVSTDE